MAPLPSSGVRNPLWVRSSTELGAVVAVLVAPGCQITPNIVQRQDSARVEGVVAQPAVKALDRAVLDRAARLDVHQVAPKIL